MMEMGESWWLGLHGLDDPGGTGPDGDGLRLNLEGREWFLDGTAGDSVTLADAGGVTVYADLDGDGEIDHITTLHAGGGHEVWSADPHAAAWGLPAVNSENAGFEQGETWGLPPAGTPELGGSQDWQDQQKSGWWRIEREENGRS